MVAEEGNRESTKWSFIAGDEDETRPWVMDNARTREKYEMGSQKKTYHSIWSR